MFGPFVLERRIAVGGTAEVFLAHPKVGVAPAPRLVVKRLLPTVGEGSHYELLEREAELHRRVKHPNVVTVYGAGMVRGEPYLAMEFVDGLDLYRALRRLEADVRRVPIHVAAHIAREVALALAAVHAAVDDVGKPLGIVHRDVTPSNVYLSVTGQVKLGDFGIARIEEEARTTLGGLKGKFAYLAPEQVAAEPFDHRADLFALGAMLGELVIGERVFPGGGQLAVLLAIRDGNIEPLRREAERLPPGLFPVCEKALARDPDDRFQNATEFANALAPFTAGTGRATTEELAQLITWALDHKELVRRLEHKIRSSSQSLKAIGSTGAVPELRNAPTPLPGAIPPVVTQIPPQPELRSRPGTEQPAPRVRRVNGEMLEDLTFARLLELIATGELGNDDEVSVVGRSFKKIREIEELSRHVLASTTAVTGNVQGIGKPDYQFVLSDTPMLEALSLLRERHETGALFVVRAASGRGVRKELYLREGKLHHVVSSERNELLGEYLVRRGNLTREQLNQALAQIGDHGGRLGDTLIQLGTVEAVDVFRAIRDQGRDRVAALCAWKEGLATFYRGTGPSHVEFPLDIDLATAIMAGAILRHDGEPARALPEGPARLVPGPRFQATRDPKELGRAPASLHYIVRRAPERLELATLIGRPSSEGQNVRHPDFSPREAAAAIVTARLLGWVALEE
jgi:serine/threonine-protein kinase